MSENLPRTDFISLEEVSGTELLRRIANDEAVQVVAPDQMYKFDAESVRTFVRTANRNKYTVNVKSEQQVGTFLLVDGLDQEIEFLLGITELPSKVQPPKDALFLMYALYNREHREAILGDMEQDFNDAIELFSPRKAAWLYRIAVLRSLWPSIIAWAARGAMFARLLEWFHKFIG